MRRLKRFLALLFVLSVFIGTVHEIDHSYHQDGACEACLFAHSPLLTNDTFGLPQIECIYVVFNPITTPLHFVSTIPTQSRSPPLS